MLQQTTIDEQIDRCERLTRLQACEQKWRERELDRILPEEYARLLRKIECLASGEPYTVRRFDPMKALETGEGMDSEVGAMVRDIGRGFAQGSRATIGWSKRQRALKEA